MEGEALHGDSGGATMVLRSRTREPRWDLPGLVFFTLSLIYSERQFNKISFLRRYQQAFLIKDWHLLK